MSDGYKMERKNASEISFVLKCFVEEWGSKQVVVAVPRCWKGDDSPMSLGDVQLEYSTLDTVVVAVEHTHGFVSVSMHWDGSIAA